MSFHYKGQSFISEDGPLDLFIFQKFTFDLYFGPLTFTILTMQRISHQLSFGGFVCSVLQSLLMYQIGLPLILANAVVMLCFTGNVNVIIHATLFQPSLQTQAERQAAKTATKTTQRETHQVSLFKQATKHSKHK